MTYFWETVDTIAPGLGWPHFGPFHLAVLAVFLLLGAVLCRGYCGMDTDKRRRWRRTVALLLIADELFKDFGSHLLGYPVLLAVVFAVMYLLLRVLRRRTAVPAGK